MPVTAGPIYPGIKDGLVFAIDPANKDSWAGPTSDTVNNLPTYNSSISGSIKNDTSGSYGVNESFTFDGTDDYIELNNDSSLDIFGDDFSVSFVFRHTNSSGAARPLITVAEFTNKMVVSLGFTSNTGVGFAFGTNGSSSPWYYNAGSGFNDGNWHHMVATRTGSTVKIYVDNIDTSFSSGGAYDVGTVNRIASGRNSLAYFPGDIGPILFYNRVLSPSEVTQNYNALKGRFGLS
jgi:hypothetical protein